MEKQIEVKQGMIYQAISGFYYVWSDDKSYATKPRGNFRHQNLKPLVGDVIEFEVDHNNPQSESRLMNVLPRKNSLIRPAVANVEAAFIVMSLVEPNFSYNLLDYFLVSMESHHIVPIIVLTKYDLLTTQLGVDKATQLVSEIKALYHAIGYTVIVKEETDDFFNQLQSLVNKGIYIVMGQSGVGKSTLLNQLLPDVEIETSEISDYLNRGRHTTREVTLYPFFTGFLADTPGFSAIDFPDIERETLSHYFPEIFEMSEHCRFRGCLHQQEPNCAVKQAVENGEIAESRYQNYCQIFEKIEQRKPIYRKK